MSRQHSGASAALSAAGRSWKSRAMDEPAWPYKVEPFACHQCGNCCRGDGYVDMSPDDVARAAALLGRSEAEFLAERCSVRADGRVHLIDQGDRLRSCTFLSADNLCQIHAAKPSQCQGFPMKWRPPDALEICAGLRHAAGLPPPRRRTISLLSG